ncbi:MAG: hypothetical protein ACLSXI_06430 [Sarcina ventriculi]
MGKLYKNYAIIITKKERGDKYDNNRNFRSTSTVHGESYYDK